MHATRNGLKPVASGSCSFAYWPFLAITFGHKIFFENPRVKNEEKPKAVPYILYLDGRNERCRRLSGNRQTDRQTDKQTGQVRKRAYRNPPAHAHRGLINPRLYLSCLCVCLLYTTPAPTSLVSVADCVTNEV